MSRPLGLIDSVTTGGEGVSFEASDLLRIVDGPNNTAFVAFRNGEKLQFAEPRAAIAARYAARIASAPAAG